MRARRSASVAVGLGLVLASLGCGGGGGSEAAKTVEVFGPYREVEADRFVESIAGFTEATGIEVRYTGSGDFTADLVQRTGVGNDSPDVAMVPQPGLVRHLVAEDDAVALSAATRAAVADNHDEDVAAFGQVDGEQYGVPFRMSIKSLVWFRPELFASRGWEVPRTLAQLDQLVEEVDVTEGIAPWCFTMGAGLSTGWTATDWVEDLVLRGSGPEVYQSWAAGEVDFASTEVSSAFDRFHDLVLAPGRVDGGPSAVIDEPVEHGDEGLFTDPPGCALYKQADFARSWMPDGTTVGPDGDVDWFALPGDDPGEVPPLVIGGDVAVALSDRPEVAALMTYLAGDEAGRSWARAGGYLSPKSTIGPEAYGRGFERELVDLAGRSPELAFDASDQMPPAVGSDLLWAAITAWVGGALDYDELAAEVDAARRAEAPGRP